ncbi:DUF3592 domain-containing protein [Primorskyibacter aestuariivivens]|uniref:DUF3592 domain-containing protein n=1 Tax=Primorskyibacter aestuariivivens TaxID=1888912 RepID=UPI002300282E|nr:DUF3592 domain-containing protein [Primorskyibacter aestuariivivens]MDA7429431.1 DUF3592 domain-containing protein [Primorskyibacter aestuariivivens]
MTKIATDSPVSLWRLFFRMGGWLVFVFLLPLIVLTVISHSQLKLAERFETEGRETVATVTGKYYRESTDSDGDRTITYYLNLKFVTDAGETVEISRSVGRASYNAAQDGDEMPIWYLESEPDQTELQRGETRTGSRVAQIIGLVFGLLTLGALWFTGGRAVAAMRARKYGAEEPATVTGHERTAMRVNNKPRYRLTWREKNGRKGKSMMHKLDDIEAFPVGSEITVYQGIKRAWWSGDVGRRSQ